MRRRILVIEDVEFMRDSIVDMLSRAGYKVTAASDPREALGDFSAGRFDVVITDLEMPRMSGIDVLRRVQEEAPGTPVILIAAHAAVEAAVEAMKLGAFDYLKKPFEAGELEIVVDRALRYLALLTENEYLKTRVGEDDNAVLVGTSSCTRNVIAQINKIADSSSTVLIGGESGTGKEVVARAIHYRSSRKDGPFLCVGCAALSAGFLESELFGHEKRSVAGARSRRKGRFELADGGTLLLKGVGEIDTHLQARLFSVLQECTIELIGGGKTRKVDVRVLAATNRDLSRAVAEGRFRDDLFGMLNGDSITVPPLRDRKEDIRPLAVHFLNKHAGEWPIKEITEEGMACLERYSWPGNVRELENVIERAIVLTDGSAIDASHLSKGLETASEARGLALATDMTLGEMEKSLILLTLERCGWHQARTAKMLGIGERTLRDKMKKWGWQKRRKAPV